VAGCLSDEFQLALLGVLADEVRSDGHRGEPALGDRARRSRSTYFAASLTRAAISSTGSTMVDLLDIRPRTTIWSSGIFASGSNVPEHSSSYSSRNVSMLFIRPKIASAVWS
jgi:hypothetical protein